MKKLLTLIAVLILCLTACELDDICLEGTSGSPNLIVVFYDKNQTDIKKSVTDLQIKGLDMETLLYDSTTDSISLPIKTISNSTSFSLIATQNGNTLEDIITFNYDPEDKFISRACGFKTRFNNLTFSTSNTLNWVEFIEILTYSISDTNNTHVKILH